MPAWRGGKSKGHNLWHMICVLSSVLLPALCYLGSLIRMCSASHALHISQSVPRFVSEHSTSRDSSDNLSVYHSRLIPFGLHIFFICKIIVVLGTYNGDNVRAKFRDCSALWSGDKAKINEKILCL